MPSRPATHPPPLRCTTFHGTTRIASGILAHVVRRAKEALDRAPSLPILIFNDATSEIIEVDFRGTAADTLQRLQPSAPPPPGPGRPRLGVVAREVTLLPRHWEWLNGQPGGASAALRRLVESARRTRAGADTRRRAQESAYRFMVVMAGNCSGFEEAARALFAADLDGFERNTRTWPVDIRNHARRVAKAAFDAGDRRSR